MKRILLINVIFLTLTLNAQNTWDFSYSEDSFTDEALMDLSFLNEGEAGETGFIGLSEDGNSFVRGDGEPIRFWAVNGGGNVKNFTSAQATYFAKFLAKMGVNMIRYHASINPSGEGSELLDVDENDVKAIWRMVAFMKKEGIYSTISPFWAHNGHMGGWVPEEWGIEGYSGNDDMWGVMYFNEKFKNAYKEWVRYLYTETNPYTGIPLKDDPAVALIQVKNEDGVFFWTMQGIKPELKKMVSNQFADWLKIKYGSLNDALANWDNVSLEDDDFANNEVDIYITWEMTLEQSGGKAKRLKDQVEFFTQVQHDFYAEMDTFYKVELGCKQLTNGCNWKTASSERLNDLERYSNTSCDVMAVNRYFDPVHSGPNAGWRIDPGDTYVGPSALRNPHLIPINIKQVKGHPFFVTESGWNLPNKYQAEGPFLIAAYQSLTGVDGFYWFNPSDKDYAEFPYFEFTRDNQGQYAMHRWTASTPGQIGAFPANALAFRLDYIKEGEIIIDEQRSFEDMFSREIPVISEESSFDPNRDFISQPDVTNIDDDWMPLTFLTGIVQATYGTESSESTISPKLSELIDAQNKIVTSSTGEIKLDYDKGICVVDAPKTQGVAGFLSEEQTFELTDVTIKSTNEYATVNVISLDDKPLGETEKAFIQVGTTYRPTDWAETPTTIERNGVNIQGFQITNTGKMPWKAQNTKVSITLKNSFIKRAVLLDAAGYRVQNNGLVYSKIAGDSITVYLPENAMYIYLDTVEETSGIDNSKNNDNSLNIYPNPMNQSSFILDVSDKNFSDDILLTICGINGAVKESLTLSGENQYVIESNLNPGIYIVTAENERMYKYGKLIVQ